MPGIVHVDVDIIFSQLDYNDMNKLPSCKGNRYVKLDVGKYTALLTEEKYSLEGKLFNNRMAYTRGAIVPVIV